jgi:hypothetical protein
MEIMVFPYSESKDRILVPETAGLGVSPNERFV